MKTPDSFSLDRRAFAILFLLGAFAFGVPAARASDGGAFQWFGGSGDANDPKPICFTT